MTTPSTQIAFRYRLQDSATGITRETAKRLAITLGVDETQVIHMALRDLALKTLPQYEADDGPLSPAQVKQLQKSAPKAKGARWVAVCLKWTNLREVMDRTHGR